MVVPMGRESTPLRRSQIQIRLEPMAELRRQSPAKEIEFRLPVVQLVEHDRAAIAQVRKDAFQTRRRCLVRQVLLGGGVGELDVAGIAGDRLIELLQREEVVVVIRIRPVNDQRLLAPIARNKLVLADRRDQRREGQIF